MCETVSGSAQTQVLGAGQAAAATQVGLTQTDGEIQLFSYPVS